MPTCLMFSLTKCPFVAASGAFSGRRPGRSRAIAATAVEGVREKWHRMGMLIHEMLTACLWVFLGRHSGLSWDIRGLDGLLGVNQSAPAMLGELSCDLPRAASSKRWYCTCAPGCSFGFSSVPQPYLCSFVHLFIRSLLPSTNQPTSRLAVLLLPYLVLENPCVHAQCDIVPAYSPA